MRWVHPPESKAITPDVGPVGIASAQSGRKLVYQRPLMRMANSAFADNRATPRAAIHIGKTVGVGSIHAFNGSSAGITLQPVLITTFWVIGSSYTTPPQAVAEYFSQLFARDNNAGTTDAMSQNSMFQGMAATFVRVAARFFHLAPTTGRCHRRPSPLPVGQHRHRLRRRPEQVPPYLRCDGVDDALQTGNIDFTSTDKMTVWAGFSTQPRQGITGVRVWAPSISGRRRSFRILPHPDAVGRSSSLVKAGAQKGHARAFSQPPEIITRR